MAMNLPLSCEKIKLSGTPAQAKWAKTIRAKRAALMQKGGVKMLLLSIKPHVTNEDFDAMRCKTRAHMLAFAHGVALHMLSCPQARWWIDHRDELPYHNVHESTRACIAHYAKTKPFK